MPFICFVPGCKGTFGVGQMHRFPKNKVLFDKWLCLIGHPEMMDKQEYILKNKRICNIHFGPECISPFKRYHSWLKEGSIPTLFLPNNAFETSGQDGNNGHKPGSETVSSSTQKDDTKIADSSLPVAFEVEVQQENKNILVQSTTSSEEVPLESDISNRFGPTSESANQKLLKYQVLTAQGFVKSSDNLQNVSVPVPIQRKSNISQKSSGAVRESNICRNPVSKKQLKSRKLLIAVPIKYITEQGIVLNENSPVLSVERVSKTYGKKCAAKQICQAEDQKESKGEVDIIEETLNIENDIVNVKLDAENNGKQLDNPHHDKPKYTALTTKNLVRPEKTEKNTQQEGNGLTTGSNLDVQNQKVKEEYNEIEEEFVDTNGVLHRKLSLVDHNNVTPNNTLIPEEIHIKHEEVEEQTDKEVCDEQEFLDIEQIMVLERLKRSLVKKKQDVNIHTKK